MFQGHRSMRRVYMILISQFLIDNDMNELSEMCTGVQCPSGQQYQACSSSCAHSCNSLSRPCARHLECVEGCYCPPGLTIGPNGDCIAISSCPCLHNGMEYPPTHKEIRPASKGLQFWYAWALQT